MPAVAHSGPEIDVLQVGGDDVRVWLEIEHDGIEFVGHLWFGGKAVGGRGAVDRAVLPGNSHDEVIARAKRLTKPELLKRFERAMRERRRYDPLRRATQDMLAKVRRLNQVAIALQAGLLDSNDGADQLAAAEAQLHDIVGRLREAAGVEEEAAPGASDPPE